jgi:hypothetical protein
MRDKVAQHALQIRQHIVVPISNNRDAFLSEPLCAAIVGLPALLRVLPTIHFDSKTKARAVEVDGVRADRMLLSKGRAGELVAAQRAP